MKGTETLICTTGAIGLAFGISCIIPDKGIVINTNDCGVEWCVTIPSTGDGAAWGYDDNQEQDVLVQTVENEVFTAITECKCMTPSEHDILDAGCGSPPCTEYDTLWDEVVDEALAACEDAMVIHYDPDLEDPTGMGHNGCVEASSYWTPVEGGSCPAPSNSCGDTDGNYYEPTTGSGPEPFSSITIDWNEVGPVIPVEVFDEIVNDPEALLDSTVRLEQEFSGQTPIGFRLSGVNSSTIAYKVGFQNDDVIEEINGMSFVDEDDFVDVYIGLRGTTYWYAKVNRGGSTTYVIAFLEKAL